MCRNFVLVSLPISSTVVWRIEPTPAEPYFRAPGFLRAVAHADEERVEACDRNPFEVFDDLVVYGPGQRAMRRMGAGNDQERVAVRVAARDHLCGEAAGRSWLWLNHDRLPKTFRHLVA